MRIIFLVLLTLIFKVCMQTEERSFIKSKGIQNILKRDKPFKITGGKKTSIEKVPYIGSAFYYGMHIGSAIILDKKWLLTAGFNVYMNNYTQNPQPLIQFRFGSNTIGKRGTTVEPVEIFIHPNYTGLWDNDIAVVKLDQKLKFSKKIKPIKISYNLPANGSHVLISGFGKDTSGEEGTLKKADVTFIDYKSCNSHYHGLFNLTEINLCTYDINVGPCAYDFGSPLVYKNKLIGVFAGSYQCGGAPFPPVYTDVTKYKKWISTIIKKHKE